MSKPDPASEKTDSVLPFDLPPRRHETAVILHVYYPDMLDEIDGYLSNLEGDFDLFISLPDTVNIPVEKLRGRYPQAAIYTCENRGRDIAPFLVIFRALFPYRYKYICKIHTKKTTHRQDGSEWRQDLLLKLLGSPGIIASARRLLDSDDRIGMLAPAGHRLPVSYFMGENDRHVVRLAQMAGMDFWSLPEFDFIAGSMFWFKPAALESLLSLKISTRDFEEETGLRDGTLAHAFERFLGFLVKKAGFRIGTIGEGSADRTGYDYAEGGARPWYALRIEALEAELSLIYRSRGWKFLTALRRLRQLLWRR